MNDDQDKKLIESIEKLLHFNINAANEEISANAVQFIQDQRLLDYVLKNHISFILNVDSTEYRENIERAESEGFVVEIVNISRQGELI